MGAWGPAIFSDDVACDVRGVYRELLEDQVPDDEAEAQVLAQMAPEGTDDEDAAVVWLALAATSSKLGRLSDATRTRALRIIDEGIDLARWDEAAPSDRKKREQALAKLRAQLVGPQPERKRVRRPKQKRTGLEVGDVLAHRSGDLVLAVRVARMDEERTMQCPIVVTLDWHAERAPTPEELPSVVDRPVVGHPVDPDPPWRRTISCIVPMGKDTWEAAGFELLGNVGANRPSDDNLVAQMYLGFSGLAGVLDRVADELRSAP
jgi:hypothetical protein